MLKPKFRMFRFGLRTMFAVVALLAVWLSLESNRALRQRQSAQRILANGGSGSYVKRWLPGRQVLAPIVGDDYFRRLKSVQFVGPEPPGQLPGCCYMVVVKPDPFLTLSGPEYAEEFTIDALRALDGLEIETLHLQRVKVSNEGLRLIGRLTSLKTLSLRDTGVSDESLVHLRGLHKLQTLEIEEESSAITDMALAHILPLKKLRDLYLNGTQVSDEGIQRLVSLTQLEGLFISNTQVTSEGAARLQRLAPHIKDVRWPRDSTDASPDPENPFG